MKRPTFFQFDLISLLIPLLLLAEKRPQEAIALPIAAALHECGHLLAARLLRIPIRSLRISILGAQLHLDTLLLPYGQEWLLCVAGPLFSFLGASIRIWSDASFILTFSNISAALGVINLLPIGKLDGGRMFRAMSHKLLPEAAASTLIRSVSFFFFLLLWMTSVYLMLRAGNSLTLFVFSLSLFWRFFVSEKA